MSTPEASRCPSCSAEIQGAFLFCRQCGRPVGRPAVNRPQAAEEGPATRAARGFPPIEICLVIVFVGIDLFVALQSIPEVVHSDQALPRLVGALGADLAMIVGLAMRRRWAFWLSAVLLFLRCVVLLGQVHRFGEEGGKTGIDIGMALGYLAAGILLIVCRVRGAYEKE